MVPTLSPSRSADNRLNGGHNFHSDARNRHVRHHIAQFDFFDYALNLIAGRKHPLQLYNTAGHSAPNC